MRLFSQIECPLCETVSATTLWASKAQSGRVGVELRICDTGQIKDSAQQRSGPLEGIGGCWIRNLLLFMDHA